MGGQYKHGAQSSAPRQARLKAALLVQFSASGSTLSFSVTTEAEHKCEHSKAIRLAQEHLVRIKNSGVGGKLLGGYITHRNLPGPGNHFSRRQQPSLPRCKTIQRACRRKRNMGGEKHNAAISPKGYVHISLVQVQNFLLKRFPHLMGGRREKACRKEGLGEAGWKRRKNETA